MKTPEATGWRWPRIPGLTPPRKPAEDREPADPWPSHEALDRVETPVTLLLSQIEAAACAVYVAHGLPDQPGEYARSPKTRQWRFLSEDLTAEERWALILAQREGSGWRFGSLADLGDTADSPPEVRRAAQVLRSCRQLRAGLSRRGQSDPAEDIQLAIELGAAWVQLGAPPATRPRKVASAPKLPAPAKPAAKRRRTAPKSAG